MTFTGRWEPNQRTPHSVHYETDQDSDGHSLWTETQAGSSDNNSELPTQ